MDPYRPEPVAESKDNTLLRVLLTGCGCLILIGIVFGLFAGRLVQKFRGPNRVVRAHMEALSTGNYQEAYSLLAETQRRQKTLQEFREELQPFRSLLPYRSLRLNSTSIRNHEALISGTLTARDGAIIPLTYELAEVNGKWRIKRFEWSLPGELQRV